MLQERLTFQQRIDAGKRLIITEISPPEDANGNGVRETAALFAGKVHAAGVSDNRDGVRMSALAAATIVKSAGIEPILHMSTRDRNRAALMADCLGAHALGITSLLCTSGTHQSLLPFSNAKNVFDIDATVLLQSCVELEKNHSIKTPFYLGAVAAPFADPVELQLVRLAQKIHVGARFAVTQPVFDLERFASWWKVVTERELHEKAAIIAGVKVLTSAVDAKTLAATRPLPMIPASVMERLDKASDARAEGIALAGETVDKLMAIKGIRGVEVVCDEDPAAALEVLAQVKSELE
jgi:methylenetetrahydrofolate reductase (NADPH)